MDLKIRYEIEFPINSSPQLLYQYISTPSGLSEWFADNVNSRGEFFTFIWNDSEEKARLCSKKSGEKVKFKWVDDQNKDTEYFFELNILVDEITKDVSLMVVDFAEESELSNPTVGKPNFRSKTCYWFCLVILYFITYICHAFWRDFFLK